MMDMSDEMLYSGYDDRDLCDAYEGLQFIGEPEVHRHHEYLNLDYNNDNICDSILLHRRVAHPASGDPLQKCKIRAFETFNGDVKTLLDRHREYRSVPNTVNRRIVEIINQCRYIALKQGLDKRQLIQSIKEDERCGRINIQDFNHVVQPCISPRGMSFARDASWMNSIGQGEKEFFQETARCGYNNNTADKNFKAFRNSDTFTRVDTKPVFDYVVRSLPEESYFHPKLTAKPEKVDLIERSCGGGGVGVGTVGSSYGGGELECVALRPPTRRAKSALLPTSSEELMENSGESDFDPSGTSDLLENMKKSTNFKGIDLDEERNHTGKIIRPMRKAATLNLSITDCCEGKKQKRIENDDDVISSDFEDFESDCDEDPPTPIKGKEDQRTLLVQTARAHACASFVQMREKMSTSTTSNRENKEPIFGNLAEYRNALSDEDHQKRK